jgi:hypothetical protein
MFVKEEITSSFEGAVLEVKKRSLILCEANLSP